MRKTLVLLTLLIGLGLMTVPAFGQLLDPHISICQNCPTGSDPNPITNTGSFQIGWDGNHTSVVPLLIIVGTYNGAAAPTVTQGGNSYSPGGTPIYGWNGSATGVGFNSFSPDAYTALGISPEDGGSSESFGNWNGGLAKNGLPTASSFTLFVYELPVTLPSGNTFINMDLEGTVTNGSYVLAYACEQAVSPCPRGKEGAVPFTTAGLVDTPPPTPEPASMFLLGTGLLGAYGLVRRKLSS